MSIDTCTNTGNLIKLSFIPTNIICTFNKSLTTWQKHWTCKIESSQKSLNLNILSLSCFLTKVHSHMLLTESVTVQELFPFTDNTVHVNVVTVSKFSRAPLTVMQADVKLVNDKYNHGPHRAYILWSWQCGMLRLHNNKTIKICTEHMYNERPYNNLSTVWKVYNVRNNFVNHKMVFKFNWLKQWYLHVQNNYLKYGGEQRQRNVWEITGTDQSVIMLHQIAKSQKKVTAPNVKGSDSVLALRWITMAP